MTTKSMNRAFHTFLNVAIALIVSLGLWFCWMAFDMARWAMFRFIYDITSLLAIVGVALVIYAWLKLRGPRD